MASYRNLFYSLKSEDPEIYKTDAKPVEYKGFLIYHRIKSSNPWGNCWDIVKDGVCVSQYAGLSGAKGVIDEPTEHFRDNLARAFPTTKLFVRKIK